MASGVGGQCLGRWLLVTGCWPAVNDQWQEASSKGPVTSSLTTEIKLFEI